MAIEKIKVFVAILELPAKQHSQFSPFGLFLGWTGWIGSRPDWQCCLAGSSKIANGPFELISDVHWLAQFIRHNKTFLGSVITERWDLLVFGPIYSVQLLLWVQRLKNCEIPPLCIILIQPFWVQYFSPRQYQSHLPKPMNRG